MKATSPTVLDPVEEDRYWSDNFRNEPYYDSSFSYDDYGPAYRHGLKSRRESESRTWDEAESEVGSTWENVKAKSRLSWDKAKHAARAAWNRVEDFIPGDSDGDGH